MTRDREEPTPDADPAPDEAGSVEAADATSEPGPETEVARTTSPWTPLRREAIRLVSCLLIAAIVGAPLAVAWAVEHTVVEADVGTSPARFTLTTNGRTEVRLGIAGTIYVPRSQGPFGVVATIEGPGTAANDTADLAAYVSPEMLALYAGLFHDPQTAIDEYVGLVEQEFRNQVIKAELTAVLGGGLLLYVLVHLLGTPSSSRHRTRATVSVVVVLATTMASAYVYVQGDADRDDADDEGEFALSIFDDTLAEGATTDSPIIRALLGGALDKTRVLIERQEAQTRAYREVADAGLVEQAGAMTGPEDGEIAVMMQSDMHCNTAMIALQKRVVEMLRDRFGDDVPAMLAIAGDLTTNGTAAEGPCIRDEAAIAGGAPVAAIAGNHESDLSVEQMKDAGMTVLDGDVEDLAGLTVLGAPDPARTELFGATMLRGTRTQDDVGSDLYAEALRADERPDLVLVHEGYAAAAFLGVGAMGEFMTEGQASLTEPVDDDVRNLPAGAVFYGHWHRRIDPRVVWNDDGTWTLVMELDTSGGAIDTPTLNDFSTPWSQPRQEASFPVVFFDEESGLPTGYQIYTFATDGTPTVEPRVDVGAP